MYSEEITGIVFDVGATSMRAGQCAFIFQGYSGDDQPKHVFPSHLYIQDVSQQELKMEIENEGAAQQQTKQYLLDTALKLSNPEAQMIEMVKNGIYQNFDALEHLLLKTFEQEMKLKPYEYPLMMSEPSLHNIQQRQKLCETVFEQLKTTNFFLCKSAVLSCFASGRSTSLILESGHTSTYVVPVHDGYALQKGIVKYDIGGKYLDQKILKYVEKDLKHPIVFKESLVLKDPLYKDYRLLQVCKDIKETMFRIEELENLEPSSYELPDGSNIKFNIQAKKIPDCLFQILKSGEQQLLSFKGIHNMVLDSINSCDIDIRKELTQNIIVCGGNTLLGGFVDKLQRKVIEGLPPASKIKLIAYPSTIERRFSSWIGGSILSSLGSFQNMWISKQEYEEHGSYIIEKKCP